MERPKHERACQACDGTKPCVPCAGSGRISESIPASDAIADAETLLRVASVTADSGYRRCVDGTNDKRTPLGRAQAEGSCAAAIFRTANTYLAANAGHLLSEQAPKLAHRYANDAARAAFRAIPGLRG
jgi:hypothetical protein